MATYDSIYYNTTITKGLLTIIDKLTLYDACKIHL